MKITKLGSATVIIETGNTKILCDPWLIDGAYYGSWCYYPPIEIEKCNFNDIDYVYISHIHPDHLDPKTMKFIDCSIPVIIHRFHQNFLKRNIERLGFNVIELENGVSFSLTKEAKITIFAADNCDPSVCGRIFGCTNKDVKGSMQIDSLCVVEDKDFVVVNTNDCPFGISKQALQEVKSRYGKIDFALIGYSSASLYPHCMMDYTQAEMELGKQHARNKGLMSGLNTLSVLQPEYYMPFAGTYILGGSNYKKNSNIPFAEMTDVIDWLQTELYIKHIESTPVLLNFSEHFCLTSKKQSKPYKPIDPVSRNTYIETTAKHFRFDFEDDVYPDNEELFQLFSKAMPRLKKKQSEVSLFEDINLVFDINEKKFVVINLLNLTPEIISDITDFENYHRFKIDARLLKRALMGPHLASWDNIWAGSHLDFARKPDIFRFDLHILINSMFV